VIDTCTRECPVIEVDISLGGARLVAVLERLRVSRGLPQRITVDNGPEFRRKALDAWAHQHGVHLQFGRPGKPVDNTFIRSLQRSTAGCVPEPTLVPSLADAQRTIEWWRIGYNAARPHGGLAGRTPTQVAESFTLLNTTRLSA
jgi:putative transposase